MPRKVKHDIPVYGEGAWRLNPGWKWASWDSAYYSGPTMSANVTMMGDKLQLTVWKGMKKVDEATYRSAIAAMNAAEEMGVKGRGGGKRRHAAKPSLAKRIAEVRGMLK